MHCISSWRKTTKHMAIAHVLTTTRLNSLVDSSAALPKVCKSLLEERKYMWYVPLQPFRTSSWSQGQGRVSHIFCKDRKTEEICNPTHAAAAECQQMMATKVKICLITCQAQKEAAYVNICEQWIHKYIIIALKYIFISLSLSVVDLDSSCLQIFNILCLLKH